MRLIFSYIAIAAASLAILMTGCSKSDEASNEEKPEALSVRGCTLDAQDLSPIEGIKVVLSIYDRMDTYRTRSLQKDSTYTDEKGAYALTMEMPDVDALYELKASDDEESRNGGIYKSATIDISTGSSGITYDEDLGISVLGGNIFYLERR